MIKPQCTGTWLTPDEVAELTATKPNSYKAQCRKLAQIGIAFLPNSIGRPLVQRDLVLKMPNKRATTWAGPNWAALDEDCKKSRAHRLGSRGA
jgi:hypothetical protein